MSDFLTMSDADFMAQGASKLAEAQAAVPQEQNPDESTASTNADTQAATEAVVAGTVEQVPAPDVTGEEEQESETSTEGNEAAASAASGDDPDETAENDGTATDRKPKVETGDNPDTSSTGLPEGASRIFETFRANGRDMKVKSVDEAIRLMQMGANYSQKQAANKKNLAFVKVLEQNGMLDHEKLAFAVDLINGKPEAIGKLIKDSKVDIHELDDDKVAAYRAESRAPSAAVLDLDEVISDIQGTEHFTRLVGEMKNWDEKSQALVGSHPESLRQLTQQMENGVYDKIMDEVNRQQVLGSLNGVPLMQAYNQVGQEMAAAGAFNPPAPKGPVKKLVTPGKKASQPSAADEERRRAAAPSKGVTTATEETKNPQFLNMSDEEFLKQIKR